MKPLCTTNFLVLASILGCLYSPVWAQSGQAAWVDNDDMLLFYEALVKVRENTLKPETSRQIVHKAIRAYMRQQDLFSDYFPPEEYQAYKNSQKPQYAGVGLDIFRDRSGKIFCIPFPGGPAEKNNLKYGDTLAFVDGRTVEGLSIFAVGNLIRGKTGASVSLGIKTSKGAVRQVSLIRKKINFKSALINNTGKTPIIRIIGFTSKTVGELKEALKKLPPGGAKIMDLRGNTGGDLHAAIKAASLFLDPGLKIVDMKTRKGVTPHLSAGKPMDSSSKLIIWQDGLTASAAEVFTAALVQNKRAVSIGGTSFGKGVSQLIVELSDGSALFVTRGVLRSPDGDYFHEHGLVPTYTLDKKLGFSSKDYTAKTAEILGSSR